MPPVKITLIGAGSRSFGPGTVRDVLLSEGQLHDYGAAFRRLLDSIHEFLPNRERTHLLYAGPASLAVYFGQLISPTIDRSVVVYNYAGMDSPRYSWGLEITADMQSPDFIVLITDGAPTASDGLGTHEEDAADAADDAKADGIEIFAVGVGTSTSTADFLKDDIVSPPSSSHYFDAADFGGLEAILADIATCED